MDGAYVTREDVTDVVDNYEEVCARLFKYVLDSAPSGSEASVEEIVRRTGNTAWPGGFLRLDVVSEEHPCVTGMVTLSLEIFRRCVGRSIEPRFLDPRGNLWMERTLTYGFKLSYWPKHSSCEQRHPHSTYNATILARMQDFVDGVERGFREPIHELVASASTISILEDVAGGSSKGLRVDSMRSVELPSGPGRDALEGVKIPWIVVSARGRRFNVSKPFADRPEIRIVRQRI